MLSWLGKKALNFRLASQIKLTQEQLLSYTPIERGYVLLFIACLRKGWKKDLPELVLAMECPPVFSEKQLLDLFYSLEDLRNLTFAKIKDAKRLNGDIIPAAILKHFEYSLHSINVGLATLAAGIRDSNTQPCAELWKTLKEARPHLLESLQSFKHCVLLQESLGDAVSLPFECEIKWLEEAQWVPRFLES